MTKAADRAAEFTEFVEAASASLLRAALVLLDTREEAARQPYRRPGAPAARAGRGCRGRPVRALHRPDAHPALQADGAQERGRPERPAGRTKHQRGPVPRMADRGRVRAARRDHPRHRGDGAGQGFRPGPGSRDRLHWPVAGRARLRRLDRLVVAARSAGTGGQRSPPPPCHDPRIGVMTQLLVRSKLLKQKGRGRAFPVS